jgi:hypothetical protein
VQNGQNHICETVLSELSAPHRTQTMLSYTSATLGLERDQSLNSAVEGGHQ